MTNDTEGPIIAKMQPVSAALPNSLMVGIIFGLSALFVVGIAMAALLYCKRRRKTISPTWMMKEENPKQQLTLNDSSQISTSSLSISQSTPNLLEETSYDEVTAAPKRRRFLRSPFRQATLPTVPTRHQSFQRQLSHKLDLSSIEFTVQQVKHKEQPSLGSIQPELYRDASIDSVKSEHHSCGNLEFTLKYDQEIEGLFVHVLRAEHLPAKDFSGTSDPYVKIYLLPDRKNKFQTKVHRKTLNPEFDEQFLFSIPYKELTDRTLQFSVYDFDRFSRHDLIGAVVIKDILQETKGSMREICYIKSIYSMQQDKVDLGELMMSLCYLPTAGRLTVTIVKARCLKAMDITGYSDPYVKVSLMCQGKRIKKKKTSVKKNTLNPVYNEAIVFDVPQENIDDICLVVKVIDYDRIGNNEIIGCSWVGPTCVGIGRDHWFEMLENPRKPIAQWYPLQEQAPGIMNFPDTPTMCNGKVKRRHLSEASEPCSEGSVM